MNYSNSFYLIRESLIIRLLSAQTEHNMEQDSVCEPFS
jgi:hypothetical protein